MKTSNHTNLLVTDTAAEGGYRAAQIEEILDAARRALSIRVKRGTSVTSPKLVRDFLTVQLFRGTINGASVHPREVVKQALELNAAAVIFAHPHPSGIAEPSHAHELITHRLREALALALVEIRVLDHLIVAGGDVVSFAETGLL